MSNIYKRLVDRYGFSPAQKIIISLVKNVRVLEVGASSGYMTSEFKKNSCIVDVVEVDRHSALQAKKMADRVYLGSLEDENLKMQIRGNYDMIVCADVLEHLVDPEKALEFLKRRLKRDGQIIISLPNVACWEMRMKLLKGQFEYEDSGILDKTHLRFYTYNTFLDLLKKLKFKIIKIYPAESRIPLEITLKKIPVLGNIFLSLVKPIFMTKYPNLSMIHYVVQVSQ